MFNKEKNTSFPQTPSVSSANWSVQGNFTPYYRSGWVCPKCGAVMSPTTSVCINCNGHTLPAWTTINTIPPYAIPCGDCTAGTTTSGTSKSNVLRDTIPAVGTLETTPGTIYDHLTFAVAQTQVGDAPNTYYQTTSTLEENKREEE